MPLPNAYEVLVDWNNDGDYLDASEDITAYVKSGVMERGRDNELGYVQVGTLELRLHNATGLFSPANTGGDLYGLLLPGRSIRVRVQAEAAGAWYDVFKGEVEEIAPSADPDMRDAYLMASGIMRRFTGSPIRLVRDTAATEYGLLALIVDAIEKAGETITVAFNAGLDSYGFAWWEDTDGFEAAREIMESSVGTLYEAGNGYLVFEDRHHRSRHTSAYTLDNGQHRWGVRYRLNGQRVRNRVTTRAHVRASTGLGTLWTLQDTPVTLAAGETRYFTARFAGVSIGLTTPVATTDWEANAQADGGGADKTASVAVTLVAEYGESAVLRVINNDAGTVYLTYLRQRGEPLNDNPADFIADDTVSQGVYGIRAQQTDCRFLDTVAWAENRSRLLLARLKAPSPDLTLTIRPDTTARLIQMLSREVSDRITVVEDVTYTNGDFYIERIRHSWDASMFETEWTLSAAPVREAHSSDDTLTVAERGSIHTNSGAGTVTLTLPQDAVEGDWYEFYRVVTQAFRIDPGAAGAIFINGAKQADDKYIQANTGDGEFVVLVCIGGGDWRAVSSEGTWTVEA